MCGIVAWYPSQVVDEADMRRRLGYALRAMKHRGPDDEGIEIVRTRSGVPVGLGNVRLAIQDPSPAGHQPMRDGTATVVMNGEIYNHRVLRADAALERAAFGGSSDTETVLRGWQAWQDDVFARLDGMFAIAIFDAANDRLTFARDRFGMKPLYGAQGDFGVVLASELRALLATGLVPKRLDRDGLSGYVRFGCVPEPHTLVQGVHRAPVGAAVHVTNGAVASRHPFWSAPSHELGEASSDAARIGQALRRATDEHLLSDVPVAVLLSGGIDSSLVAALTAQAAPRSVTAFTVGFEEAAYDETPWARKVADRHGMPHEVVRLTSDEITEQIHAAMQDMDAPSVDGFNTWIVSRAIAAAGFKVALTGLGGDELFGGYETFARMARAERLARRLGWLPRTVRARLGGGGERGARIAQLIARGRTRAERYDVLRSFWSDRGLAQLGIQDPPGLATWTPPERAPIQSAMSLLELGGYLRSMLLRDTDANSMAHSLELRVPFLDHRLVETCLRTNAAAGPRPKATLLAALGGLLPEGLAERPKQGFVLPMDDWMRGPLRDLVEDGLLALAPHVPGARAVARAWRDGAIAWTRPWALATLGHWLRAHGMSDLSA